MLLLYIQQTYPESFQYPIDFLDSCPFERRKIRVGRSCCSVLNAPKPNADQPQNRLSFMIVASSGTYTCFPQSDQNCYEYYYVIFQAYLRNVPCICKCMSLLRALLCYLYCYVLSSLITPLLSPSYHHRDSVSTYPVKASATQQLLLS
jgi:hypothetical protein